MRSHVSPQRAVALTLVVLVATAGILALSVGSAVAARGHVFGGAFGEPCTSEPCGAGQLKEPSAVAVNEATGQVFVLDQGDERIERFSSTGAYEMQFDGSETPTKAFLFGPFPLTAGIAVDNSCQLKGLSGSACSAADPSNGDVYVTDRENGVVDKFTPEGVYTGVQLLESGTTPFLASSVVSNIASGRMGLSGFIKGHQSQTKMVAARKVSPTPKQTHISVLLN
jgi:hypothetical protein